ncbi:hypothetical protein BDN71DRAFT_1499666 [Pleurotus eryngii]|uniref:Uncharacterized protein n=1 Tax=Pleurotus eryngii TaxID=5323 RepID=A0A9P5ZIQ0_PLEER|nr:hypothetical protein BDN71DRAFT_1499666 [Pleurotus eryngii]
MHIDSSHPNREFPKEGSIFTLLSTAKYAVEHLGIKNGAVDRVQEYVSIEGFSKAQKHIEVPGIATAVVKTKYRFTGRRGAVLTMHRPQPRSLDGGVKGIPSTDLRGKNLVTSVINCPDYYMFLSQKSRFSNPCTPLPANAPTAEAGLVSIVLQESAFATAGVPAGGGATGGWRHYGIGGTYKASEPGRFIKRWVPAIPPWEVLDGEEEPADNGGHYHPSASVLY